MSGLIYENALSSFESSSSIDEHVVNQPELEYTDPEMLYLSILGEINNEYGVPLFDFPNYEADLQKYQVRMKTVLNVLALSLGALILSTELNSKHIDEKNLLISFIPLAFTCVSILRYKGLRDSPIVAENYMYKSKFDKEQ